MELFVLWDIDHTLIENAGVSKEIYAAAFRALSGREPTEPARTEGRTDRLIMRDMFVREGLPVPDWPFVETALAQAGEARLEELRRRGAALPGVHDALKAASAQAG
ncbi:phosphoglycolate phosphatase-like HAD superfamily hydrolase [Streptomyces sp. PvR018]